MSVTTVLSEQAPVSVLTAAGRGAAASSTRLRLTRRGRMVFGTFATVLIAGLLAWVAAFAAPQAFASDSASTGEQFHYAVVQPGESLWSLATELDASADPRDLVAEIVRLNQLQGSDVQAGQPIAVPLRYSENPTVVSADELGA